MRTLKVTSGAEEGRTLEIEGDVVIGREGADLLLPDTELSRRHAILREVEAGVEIEDLGSMNGTFVNGERITAPVTLTATGSLKLGTTEMAVEVVLPVRDVPDVTVPRAVSPLAPEGDVTRQRPIPAPEVTRVRPVESPPGGGPPPAAGPPAGGPPPGAGPPAGGPPGGRPPKVLLAILKIPGAKVVLPRLIKLPAPLRIVVLLLILAVIIAIPVVAVMLLL